MTVTVHNKTLVFASLIAGLFFYASITYAANAHTDSGDSDARILEGIEAEQADTTALMAEAQLFKSIGMGFSLSLAQCELLDDCTQIVNPGELNTLISTLDKRINGLIIRQEQEEQDYTDLLALYVDQREDYIRYQDKLEEIAGPFETAADTTADTFGTEAGQTGDQLDLSIFEDADESLDVYSDEGLPLEDEFNP